LSLFLKQRQEIHMRSKLAIPALVIACTFGAAAVASAQDNTAQPSKEAAAPGVKAKKHHKVAHHKMKPSTTTGMSRGKSAASPSGSNKQGGGY
jgi:hypothetical protein